MPVTEQPEAGMLATGQAVIWFGDGSHLLEAAWSLFEVHHVKSGEAVLRALEGSLAYCVVFDLDYAVENLIDFLAQVRRAWPYVGLLAITDRDRRQPTGALALFDTYLYTDQGPDVLEAAVTDLLHRALHHPERLAAGIPTAPDYQRLNDRMRHLEGLVQAAFAIPARVTEGDIIGNLREVAQVAVDADDLAVFLASQQYSHLSDVLKLGAPGDYLQVCQGHLDALPPEQREVYVAEEVLLRERVPGVQTAALRVREAKAAEAWSYMRLPLTIDERLIGFVALFSQTPGRFNGAHLQLGRLFAAQIATALRNMRLYFRLNRVERQQRAVNRVARAIAEDIGADAVLVRIVEEAVRLVKGQGGVVLLSQADRSLKVRAGYNFPVYDAWNGLIPPGLGQVGVVALTGQPSIVNDYPNWPNAIDELRSAFPPESTLIGVPLTYRGRVVGVLQVLTGRVMPVEAREMQDMLMMLAPQAATAIMKAQLHDMVRQDRQQLRAILDHTTAAVVVCDADGTILMINPELRRLVRQLGYEPEELIGRRVQDLARDLAPDRPLGLDGFRQVMEINFGEVGEYVVHIAPITGPDGTLERYVAVGQEVSELRRLDRLRSDLIHILSHDLRNPLGLARGSIELIDEPDLPDEQRLQLKEMIINALERMEQLISDVVDLEMTETVGEHTALPYDVAAMVGKVIERSRDKAKRSGLALTYHERNKPERQMRGHAMLIGQAVDNLVNNAIKYTPEGGTVDVTLDIDGEYVVVEVRDNGLGIPAANLPHIFEQFYRVNEPRTRGIPGTGLGLSLVKKIAEAHGGCVTVSSAVDEGSVFRLYLPLETPMRAEQTTMQITRIDLSGLFHPGDAASSGP